MSRQEMLPKALSHLWLVCALVATPCYASLIGQTVNFTFSESGLPDGVKNGVAVVDPGFELSEGDGSGIDLANILSTGEFIDIGVTTITFNLSGGGAAHSVPGYQTTGFGADATYRISGFDQPLSTLFELSPSQSIGFETTNMVGNFGSALVIGSDFIEFTIGEIGILDVPGVTDFGSFTLKAVPVPAAMPLFMTGLLSFGYFARKRRH